MEFGLLQLLVERRRSVTDAELAYVAWHEIADALSFRSVQADSENVRELVHRVRRKLGGVQADDLIESKRGVGYRLAGEPGLRLSLPLIERRKAARATQVWWARRVRRLGLAWQNALEIARFGRLRAVRCAVRRRPRGARHRLRRYAGAEEGVDPVALPLRPAADGHERGLRHLARLCAIATSSRQGSTCGSSTSARPSARPAA